MELKLKKQVFPFAVGVALTVAGQVLEGPEGQLEFLVSQHDHVPENEYIYRHPAQINTVVSSTSSIETPPFSSLISALSDIRD